MLTSVVETQSVCLSVRPFMYQAFLLDIPIDSGDIGHHIFQVSNLIPLLIYSISLSHTYTHLMRQGSGITNFNICQQDCAHEPLMLSLLLPLSGQSVTSVHVYSLRVGTIAGLAACFLMAV